MAITCRLFVIVRVCLRSCAQLALLLVGSLAATSAIAYPAAVQKTTLETIKERGAVRCGVSEGIPGFSVSDEKGEWRGFDVDLCRALAAAIFDDPTKVEFTPLTAEKRFVPLVAGSIDVLARTASWTLSREASLGIEFAAVTYYGGQGFMTRKSRGTTSARELEGTKICVERGTTNELNLADYFRDSKLYYSSVPMETAAEAAKAYDNGDCDVVTGDISQLYAERIRLKTPDDHTILPDTISKEPLALAVRQGDDRWLNVVKWTHYAMVNAEELGVSRDTVPQAMASERAAVKRLLGLYGGLGEALGLSNDWVVRIVRHVGNYGESFERNLGAGSKLAIPRGLNELWSKGGLQYAPPFR